jgi:pSer/pThr/pTyr-binding forkhead associated (FHA) protein
MTLQLLIEDFDGAQTFVPLEGDEVTIGRVEGNTIQLTEQNVSRKHARLVADDGEWFVEDLASYNGIRVNGVPTSGRVKLHEGDTLQIGDYSLVLTGESARATLNLDGRGPANQGGVTVDEAGGAASSGALPRLAAAAPSTATRDESVDGGRPGGAGAAIGGVVVALAACGAVAAWALGLFGAGVPAGSGGPAADKAVVAANDAPTGAAGAARGTPQEGAASAATGDGSPAVAAGTVGSAGAGASPTDVAPPGGDDAAADPIDPIADPDAGDAAPPADPTADEPAPTAKATGGTSGTSSKSSKTSKSGSTPGTTAAAPTGDPSALLSDARKASLSGDHKAAYKLAKESYAIDKSADALQQMGVSACKMGDEKKARFVYDKLSGSKKTAIEKLCASSGVVLAGE